ncbi:uncharacterized protein LOC101859393 [Aplysia californica]|uniref:Uncharacterized protein LOC101859393 n=1 Tax=Aplysia californica TaxID=6500 RepID=A0ABM0JJ43_APLCA|nr:uncharacterized protein LOC101859393 [Aplysia californica]XP_005094824.1 uncharacterized protein LOC101859393 [Aplysia californica]
MDFEMESAENLTRDNNDASVDLEWQVDSEWIDLSTSAASSGAKSKKGRKSGASKVDKNVPQNCHFIPTSQGSRFLVVENQTLRLSRRSPSGYSYWVCSIPCCNARCVLDPAEKITRYSGEHNHDADVSRAEYKIFINALKLAVKENPHVKPKVLYDAELERARERWKKSNKNYGNEDEPCLPSFDTVRTAMYNTRNAVLSSFSLKAAGDETVPVEAGKKSQAGPSRSTRSSNTKGGTKRKSTSAKAGSTNSTDLEELEEEEKEEEEDQENENLSDEDEKASTSSKTSVEDVNFYFLPSSRGCQLLVIEDCLLYQNAVRSSGRSYWKCQKEGCFFRAVYDSPRNSVIKTTGLHNHPPDVDLMMKRQFIQNVKHRILENPHVPAKKIYDEEVEKVKQEGDLLGVTRKVPGYSCIKHYVYRMRKTMSVSEDAEEDEEEEIGKGEEKRREITELDRVFLEESAPSSQQEESCMNMSIITPTPIRSSKFPELSFYFIPSKQGKRIFVVNDFTLRLNAQKTGGRFYWKCTVDPCLYRCVYNDVLNDIVKVSGKHTHVSNAHRLRIREFSYLLKARMSKDPTLTPKRVYDQEIAKLRSMEKGEQLVKCLPAFSSVRTSLYNYKHKKTQPEETVSSKRGATYFTNDFTVEGQETVGTSRGLGDVNIDGTQDISPKDLTHLSLEDNDPMDQDAEENDEASPDRSSSSSSGSNALMDIAAPSLYDSHDIIDQYCNATVKVKTSTAKITPLEEPEHLVISLPDPASYSISFVPTNRGSRALVVNGCVLRISYTREYTTYWRCKNSNCSFRCSYDSKSKRLMRISGEHNHPVNAFSLAVKNFVRKMKKRVSIESDLSPKIIYDEEIARLKSEGKDSEFLSKLPNYESLKSTLYKVKSLSSRSANLIEDQLDAAALDDSEGDESSELALDAKGSNFDFDLDDPPYDIEIESAYTQLTALLPSWLDPDPDKRILDGHPLVKKSESETSTGWACVREGCPFRCVVDRETEHVTRSQLDHTHRPDVKYHVSQALIAAVRRRAVMDVTLSPKLIYEQEKRRMEKIVSGNKMLLKFLPNLTKIYQLVMRTRANPPQPAKQKLLLKSKSHKDIGGKKSLGSLNEPDSTIPSCSSSSNNSTSSTISSTSSSGVTAADYLIEQCHEETERISSYLDSREQHMKSQRSAEPHHILFEPDTVTNLPQLLQTPESSYTTQYPQQTSFQQIGTTNYTNIVPSQCTSLQQNSFTSMDRQIGFNTFSGHQEKNSQFPSVSVYTQLPSQQHSQQLLTVSDPQSEQPQPQQLPLTVSTNLQQISVPSMVSGSTSSILQQAMLPSPTPTSHSSENVFTLHGYPLMPATAQIGNVYWQCRIPSCPFQCVLNASTSQVVQISSNHNHDPPGSQSAFASQVVKMLQRRSAETLDQSLVSVYSDYVRCLRNVLDSDEILSCVPRFQDVAQSMQNARTAMVTDSASQNLILETQQVLQLAGTSNQGTSLSPPAPGSVMDFHFDSQSNCLVVCGEQLLLSWTMNEVSYWRCRRPDCRFKCVYDEEQQCVHLMNCHTLPCPATSREDDRCSAAKRKLSEKSLARRAKFPRLDSAKLEGHMT